MLTSDFLDDVLPDMFRRTGVGVGAQSSRLTVIFQVAQLRPARHQGHQSMLAGSADALNTKHQLREWATELFIRVFWIISFTTSLEYRFIVRNTLLFPRWLTRLIRVAFATKLKIGIGMFISEIIDIFTFPNPDEPKYFLRFHTWIIGTSSGTDANLSLLVRRLNYCHMQRFATKISESVYFELRSMRCFVQFCSECSSTPISK